MLDGGKTSGSSQQDSHRLARLMAGNRHGDNLEKLVKSLIDVCQILHDPGGLPFVDKSPLQLLAPRLAANTGGQALDFQQSLVMRLQLFAQDLPVDLGENIVQVQIREIITNLLDLFDVEVEAVHLLSQIGDLLGRAAVRAIDPVRRLPAIDAELGELRNGGGRTNAL